MLQKTMVTMYGLVFVALMAPASAQQSGTSGSETASAGDLHEDAMQKAGQIGIQDATSLDGAIVLEGTSPMATPLYLIVGPTGDLLAIARPMSVQSGYLATQRDPATPGMWDPVAVENAMQSLELGERGIAGEVPSQ